MYLSSFVDHLCLFDVCQMVSLICFWIYPKYQQGIQMLRCPRRGSLVNLFFSLVFILIWYHREILRSNFCKHNDNGWGYWLAGYQIFQEDEFKQALFIYTLEIGVDPSNVGFYVDRALAKIELENFRGKLKTMIF